VIPPQNESYTSHTYIAGTDEHKLILEEFNRLIGNLEALNFTVNRHDKGLKVSIEIVLDLENV